MKKYLSTHIVVFLFISTAVLLQSCDKGFEDLNTNPDASGKINPEYVFSKAQIDAARNQAYGTPGTMQYTTTFNEVAGFGSKYIFLQGNAPYVVFNNGYVREINEMGEVIRAIKDDPELINELSAARIWRAYCFHLITDQYGDIPYSEAGAGYTKGIYKPKYDAQEDIYADMLKELEEAALSFDPSKKTFGNSDLLYGGNIDSWKKLSYSLMLRLGMRLTKVDANLAESWVKKAIAGGVITEDADIAAITSYSNGQDINKNPIANSWLSEDYIRANGRDNQEGGKYQKNFIDYLKANKDPRLGVISVVWVENGTGYKADTAFDLQKGMPSNFINKPADFGDYSEPNPNTMLKYEAPMLLVTNAETNLLLAEAAIRGWYTGNASDLFEKGTGAGLRQWSLYGSAGVIDQTKIDQYIAAHPFNESGSFEEKMDQIHTQLWVALFPNSMEAFSNWRRTGYPQLVPNVVPGNVTGGQIFRRMIYPPSEVNLNKEQLDIVIARQGPNTFLTRIWWDVETAK
ncbi:MAG TPA: SusD/RagB family nutrient-binding outer membrane lipoprotein [Bacteroidales bacterium]|nr:SusD/RagB family nutrient-binding outer membrane lipoprotein [Bacteroidales bacterium]HPT20359.1 SusD/RagB family nutrient-binding outer membrane lipoprotein [Bacteroidales bacterium]